MFARLRSEAEILGAATSYGAAPELVEQATPETVMGPTWAGPVAPSAARVDTGDLRPAARLGLTRRARAVPTFLVAGTSNKGIAAPLEISEETVKPHVRGLCRNLRASDRDVADLVALRRGVSR